MNNPIVSACIITYQHEAYINDCIEGAISQNFKGNYEIVIGEDHSADKTANICKEFAKKYPSKIKLICNNTNLGMIGNWINTLNNCTGKYIAICEGDDYWIDPLKLQKQVDFLEENPECSLCCHMVGRINYESGKEEKLDYINSSRYLTNEEIISAHGMKTPTLSYVFRREYLSELPVWFRLAPIADIPLTYYLMTKGKVYCFSNAMGTYRSNLPNSWTDLKRKSSRLKSLKYSVKYAAFIQGFNNYSDYKYKKELANMKSQSSYLKTFIINLLAFSYNILYQKK